MFASSRQLFATSMFVVDGVLVFAAWIGAWWLRFHALGIPAPLGIPPLALYLWTGAVLVPTALLALRSFRMYRSARTARLGQELFAAIQAVAIVTALAGMGSFFTKGELSRYTVALFFLLCTVLLWTVRIVMRLLLRWMRSHGRNLRHVLIVGTGPLANTLLDKIEHHRDFGLVVEGLVSAEPMPDGTTIHGLPVLGPVSELPRLVESTGAELVYLALARPEWKAEEEALQAMADSTAAVRIVPDLTQAFMLNPSVEDFDGMPVVLVSESPEQGWNAVLKRGFDLGMSGASLVALSPVMLVVAVLVKLDSPGPVFYTQERVGISGRRFWMLKFRSMRFDAEQKEPGWTVANDPRRTKLGSFLRKYSLDELPQLWNVFMGDMSLVGPRPEQPAYVEQFRSSIPRYFLRHHVKAGMTGWAQVNGLRGDTPLDKRIEYDLYYIENWSLLFDLRILFLTVGRVFRDAAAH
jgi:Undecaprenyl-phosphate glucose phosphotransferase